MAHVPYIGVNITALCAFALLFVTVLASKKNREIRAFLYVLADLGLWAAGSVFMRLQIWPGISVWFYISLTALFAIAPLCYHFACVFVQERPPVYAFIQDVVMLTVLLITPTGLFLAPPVPELLADGRVIFVYSNTLWVIIPGVLLVSVVANIAMVLRSALKKRGAQYPGLLILIIAQLVLLVGNVISIIPGVFFPADMLSGIICAVMIVWALYRRRMFNLTLDVSRTLVTALLVILIIGGSVISAAPLENYFITTFRMSEIASAVMTAVLLSLLMGGLYISARFLLQRAFTAELRRDKIVGTFSTEIAKNLDFDHVVRRVIDTLTENISVDRAYICLPDENGRYVPACGEENSGIAVAADSLVLAELRGDRPWMETADLRTDPMIRDSEQELLDREGISCILPMSDDRGFVGLVLLGPLTRGSRLTQSELEFASTITTISAIAIRNASLYDEVFREARIDSLTGVYNYRYFIERIEQLYSRDPHLALVYIDADDMRMYNQLYGVAEGDRALRSLAQIITGCAAGIGEVFRTGGKIFAVLLPGCDEQRAAEMTREIRCLAAEEHAAPEHGDIHAVTVSCGICAAPAGASGVGELMDNADIAVFHAKASGKNDIRCFEVGGEAAAPRERVMRLINRGRDNLFNESVAAINALTAAIDAKDHYTFRHSRNVARYGAVLGAAAGLNDDQVVQIYEAGLLHDIGKISIPEAILGKTERLTDEENAVMKTHVNNSISMIRHLNSMDYLIPAVVSHHERWDGKGYPRGVSGEDIPLPGRCLAIADAFDAMTTDRPYRKGLDIEYAREQIIEGAGTQFAPELARLFADLIDRGEIVPDEE